MTEPQIKTCQSCKSDFTIAPEDFAFYAKIDVPPPTFCPDCRSQRRMTWRNERSLYPRECEATGKNVLAMFSPSSNVIVYDKDYWWSDEWDQLASGRDYDFSRPFFEQFQELLHRAPLPNLANTNATNSDYGNHNANCKDCYLLYASFECENVLYSRGMVGSSDSMDLYVSDHTQQCYDSLYLANCYNVAFSSDIDDSSDTAFALQSKNLDRCVGCINLRQKTFQIFNHQYSQAEYEAKLAELDLGSFKNLQDFQRRYSEFIAPYPRRFASIATTENVTGHMCMRSKNVQYGFDLFGGIEDSKYLTHAVDLKDSYDGYGCGGHAERMYEVVDSGINASGYAFTVYAHHNSDVGYVYCCHNSQNLFGCVGLRSKQYCILNKQYTKEEYEALVPRIIEQMKDMPYTDAKGRIYSFGEFFPVEISPFAYNETIAQEYYPLTAQEIEARGYRWLQPQPSHHPITKQAAELPDHIRDVDGAILQETIGCAHNQDCHEQCTQAFRIQPKELAFLIEYNYPLPRLCPNCRHYARLKQRLPLKLWERSCQCAGKTSKSGEYTNLTDHDHGDQACTVMFQTPYDPARPEMIYCKDCITEETV